MIRQSVILVADLLIAIVVNLTHEVIPVFHITRTGYNYYKLVLTVRVINMIKPAQWVGQTEPLSLGHRLSNYLQEQDFFPPLVIVLSYETCSCLSK